MMKLLCSAAALFCLVSLSGCLHLGPAYQPPEPPTDMPAAFHHAAGTAPCPPLKAPEDAWWKAFNNPALDALVAEVLDRNLSIQQAVAGVLVIRSQFKQAEAETWPTVSVGARAARSRRVVNSIGGGLDDDPSDLYSLTLPATFEWDLWGRLAWAQDAVRADLLASEENRRIVTQTVVAETVSLFLQKEFLERRIEVNAKSLEAYQSGFELAMRLYRDGRVTNLDVQQARRALARARLEVPALRRELGRVQQQLCLLAGRYPRGEEPGQPSPGPWRTLPPVPPGLPSDLLARRPDIRQAEANLQALHARVGAAYTSRFPRITLTAEWGYGSDMLSDLFKSDSMLWNIATGLFQPLIDFSKLKASQREAEARFQQGEIAYARKVLSAFAEVENALLNRQLLLQQHGRTLEFLGEARAVELTARRQYEQGLADCLTLLDAQQTRFQAEQERLSVEQAIDQNRVTLHRVLGGSWDEETTASAGQPARDKES